MRHGPAFRIAVSALLLAASLAPDVSAQTGTLAGTVTDAQSQAPVTGAVLIREGTDHTGLSRDDGRFVLAAVPVGDHVLRVECIGYRPSGEKSADPQAAPWSSPSR